MAAGIKIKGFDELIKTVKDPKLLGLPLNKFLTKSALAIQNRARQKSPVDRGQLRQAISHEVERSPIPSWAKVGVIAAPFGTPLGVKAFSMEYGTGKFGEHVNTRGLKATPSDALNLWAKRHGFKSGAQVAFIINKRGGIEPRRFLREAYAASAGDIKNFGKDAMADIKKRWQG